MKVNYTCTVTTTINTHTHTHNNVLVPTFYETVNGKCLNSKRQAETIPKKIP